MNIEQYVDNEGFYILPKGFKTLISITLKDGRTLVANMILKNFHRVAGIMDECTGDVVCTRLCFPYDLISLSPESELNYTAQEKSEERIDVYEDFVISEVISGVLPEDIEELILTESRSS